MSTLSSANVTDVNLVLVKERTHKIKIKYSMHQYSIIMHILGNWLIETILYIVLKFPFNCTCFQRGENSTNFGLVKWTE